MGGDRRRGCRGLPRRCAHLASAHVAERISVAMCTRDGARFVEAQLKSILRQQRLPDEIVVSDDASADSTVEIVERVVASSPFDVVITRNAAPLGAAANFASALRRCTGDVVALCDQDDVWMPDKLAVVEDRLARGEAVAVFSDAELVDADGNRVGLRLWESNGLGPRARRRLADGADVLPALLRWNVVTGATLAIRREVVDLALPLPPDTLHDEWLALIAAGLGPVVAVEDPLVHYRVHAASSVGVPPRRLRHLLAIRRDDGEVRASEQIRFAFAARRLQEAGRDSAAVAIAAKADFAGGRAALPPHLSGRILPVGASLLSRRYHRLAHGWRSAAHDLVFGP